MNEKKIQSLLRKFARERDWEKYHTLKNLAVSVNLESSELLEIFQWHNLESNQLKQNVKDKISEEVADILLYLLRFADIAKLDLEAICLKKISINAKKYPIELAKGNSTKYINLNKQSTSFNRRAKSLRENLLKRKKK
ncbi:MAG: nucleotide pyrophosphohydrolase [Rickettsiales bacterium]|nr:nucleotide pyrophosphohydrolase [Rickettsiales bacterium]|tara:strand:+ start:619 stop:1032 length:414 start_codon:yes stop_codon:yes gene_type:complete